MSEPRTAAGRRLLGRPQYDVRNAILAIEAEARAAALDEARAAVGPDALADLRVRITALTEGDGIIPGSWHAVESGDKAAYGWWLDNDAGDSSFPLPEDVAVFVNVIPRLLAAIDALRETPR